MVKGYDTQANAGSGAEVGTPWQVDLVPEGRSRVAGLVLGLPGKPQAGDATLADALRLWSDRIDVAVVASPDEVGALEAFIDPAMLGFVGGKLVLSLRMDPLRLADFKRRAVKVDFMESTTRKFTLSPEDLELARGAPIVSAAFVPQAQLDADTVIGRFGQPAQRLPGAAGSEHLLYPDKGLEVVISPKGRELIQYVAPARFEELRAPLVAAGAASAAASPNTGKAPLSGTSRSAP
jgi:hypothetical protein